MRLLQLIHQFLDHSKGSGTMLNVLLMYMDIVGHGSFREVREFGAICRADGIDRTQIGFTIQKLAGLASVHPLSQPVFRKRFLGVVFYTQQVRYIIVAAPAIVLYGSFNLKNLLRQKIWFKCIKISDRHR